MSATTTATPESTNSSSYSVSNHSGNRHKSRIGNLTAAQAKAFLRKGVQNVHVDPNTVSPPPAYSTAASYEPQQEDQEDDLAGGQGQAPHLLQQEAGYAGGFIEDEQMALAFDNHHDPRADTPFSSPEITPPADGSRRKPRSVSGPPTSMPMGMKERPGPEPDSAEWAKLTNRCDPINIRDRYNNPLQLERTILSPAVTEVTEMPTRPGSFRTKSSMASLLPSHTSQADHAASDDPISSTSSNVSVASAALYPPSFNGITEHLSLLHGHSNEKAKSDPALKHVRTVSAPSVSQRAHKSSSALVEVADEDEQEELQSNSNGPVPSTPSPPSHQQLQPKSSLKSVRRKKSKHRKEHEERDVKAAEERFAKRLQAREQYLDRKDMLNAKSSLLRTFQHSNDPVQQASIMRDIGEMSLSSSMDLAANGRLKSEGYKKVAESAVVYLRQALERQIPIAQSGSAPNCTSEDVSETWYLLGRAHEALSNSIDAPEGLAQRQFALASYGHAIESTRNSVDLGRIWCSLGVLQCSLQNYVGARDAFDKAVKEDSTQVRAWMNLGQLWEAWFSTQGTEEEKAQSTKRARNAYFRALRLEPSNVGAQESLEALGGPPDEMSYSTSLGESTFSFTDSVSVSNNMGHDDDEGEETRSLPSDAPTVTQEPEWPAEPTASDVYPVPPSSAGDQVDTTQLEGQERQDDDDEESRPPSPQSVDTSESAELPVPHTSPIQQQPHGRASQAGNEPTGVSQSLSLQRSPRLHRVPSVAHPPTDGEASAEGRLLFLEEKLRESHLDIERLTANQEALHAQLEQLTRQRDGDEQYMQEMAAQIALLLQQGGQQQASQLERKPSISGPSSSTHSLPAPQAPSDAALNLLLNTGGEDYFGQSALDFARLMSTRPASQREMVRAMIIGLGANTVASMTAPP